MKAEITITAERFKEMTGFEPKDDDLERTNCEKAGSFGHYLCGICEECGKPNFCCSCSDPKPWTRKI